VNREELRGSEATDPGTSTKREKGRALALSPSAFTCYRSRMNVRRFVFVVIELCLLWSVLLTGAAALGSTWVLDRVAGGLYAGESMPPAMRVLYLVTALLCLGVMVLEARLLRGVSTRAQRVLGWIVVGVFVLSTLVNVISPSAPERWNALPAAGIALGTILLLRRRT
jgi:hypothetical protein